MTNSTLKCKHCKEYFPRGQIITLPGGRFCSMQHVIEHSKAKAQRIKAKRDRAQHKADKERIKPKAKWLSELQALVNEYVRLRDAADGCISCDKGPEWTGQWHCSHYFSRGHSSALRYNLWNMHKSCSVCNSHLSGNIEQYTPRLIEKIGQDRYEWLCDHKNDIANHDIEWIKRAIRITRKAISKAGLKSRR